MRHLKYPTRAGCTRFTDGIGSPASVSRIAVAGAPMRYFSMRARSSMLAMPLRRTNVTSRLILSLNKWEATDWRRCTKAARHRYQINVGKTETPARYISISVTVRAHFPLICPFRGLVNPLNITRARSNAQSPAHPERSKLDLSSGPLEFGPNGSPARQSNGITQSGFLCVPQPESARRQQDPR